MLRAVLPVLRAQRSGYIFQGSSLYGQSAHPGVGLLAATKYALEGLSDALVGEVAPLGIKVTLVQPGPTATAFLDNLDFAATQNDYDQTVREVLKTISALPPQAFSDPAQIAAGIRTALESGSPTAFGIGRGRRPRHACGVARSAGRSGRLVERNRDRRLLVVGSKDGCVSFSSVGGPRKLIQRE